MTAPTPAPRPDSTDGHGPDCRKFADGHWECPSPHPAPRSDAPEPSECRCPPCPGRGNDGHGLNHCAECCFGSGVEAELDCPIHGDPAYSQPSTVDAGGLSEERVKQLAADLREAVMDYGNHLTTIQGLDVARAVLAAGYLSPEDVADREKKARAEALLEAADAWHERQVALLGDIDGYKAAKGVRWWLRARASSAPTEGEQR